MTDRELIAKWRKRADRLASGPCQDLFGNPTTGQCMATALRQCADELEAEMATRIDPEVTL